MREINSLVFSSGGINGLYFVGCLRAIEEYKIIENITRIIGTSAGAIFATLITLKYTYNELHDAILHIDTSLLLKISIENIMAFTKEFGIDDGEKMKRVMEVFFIQKMGKRCITFQELYNWNPVHLILTGTCLDTNKLEYFDYINTPDMKVVDAIRISASIPLLFTPVKYKGKLYIDGAVLCPYPVCHKIKKSDTVLGFNIQEKSNDDNNEKTSLFTYMNKIIHCIHSNLSYNKELQFEYKHLIWTVNIYTDNISLQFSVDKNTKLEAFQKGYEATKEILERRGYKIRHRMNVLIKCIKRKQIMIELLKDVYNTHNTC